VLEKKNLFRKAMLHKCQEAFNDNNQKDVSENNKEVENMKKLRVMANILFIGEL